MNAAVIAVARDSEHRFAKQRRGAIRLLAGHGVEGDAHAGVTVQHLSRLAKTPQAPNLRQVHLIPCELFDELARAGHAVGPGEMGENITTSGIALLDLPRGARLRIGAAALIEVTGLRNPCRQIDGNIGPGAMAAVLAPTEDGELQRKAGVMAIVIESGEVSAGDAIVVEWIPAERVALAPV